MEELSEMFPSSNSLFPLEVVAIENCEESEASDLIVPHSEERKPWFLTPIFCLQFPVALEIDPPLVVLLVAYLAARRSVSFSWERFLTKYTAAPISKARFTTATATPPITATDGPEPELPDDEDPPSEPNADAEPPEKSTKYI